jgi:hypothetical protein
MSRIYLDKLLEFTHSTYTNYYNKYIKTVDIEDEIIKIKQNISLNEKGTFFKYYFIDLSSVISTINYDEQLLIFPICFNVEENQEWFNLLNCLLLVLNEDYLKETNISKKNMLQIADKMYKKHVVIDKQINNENYKKIAEHTKINLIILNNQENTLNVNVYSTNNTKWIVCYKHLNYYFPVFNFEKKYYNSDSSFINYLISISKSKTDNELENILNENKKIEKSEELEETEKLEETEIKKPKEITKENIKNKNGGYEELIIDEDCALYISEAVDVKNTKKKKEKKKKNNKSIFITQETKLNEENKLNEEKQITKISETVFKKTEILDKKKVSEILSNIKTTTKLDKIQSYAIELGLTIVGGSTKEGKPKNKTKSELIEEIKKLELKL